MTNTSAYDACDKCGRRLTRPRQLHTSAPTTTWTLIGQYGPACAAAVVTARAGHGELTYDDRGRELAPDGTLL